MAGDEENPEIEDETNDITGPLTSVIPSVLFEDIDIISAWFFETENQQDYLSISLKISNIKKCYFPTIYVVNWTFGGVRYSASYGIVWLGLLSTGLISNNSSETSTTVFSSINTDKDTITIVIPKDLIGTPHQGDVLTDTQALAIQTLPIISSIGWEDHAPNEGYGRTYSIKY